MNATTDMEESSIYGEKGNPEEDGKRDPAMIR